ncbi:pentapeptide repeat-containing protein [Nonomuraea sp. NPDC049758]|uniref:pentapeptide repeat-containing protein n=1 Tax=Nonomuraea sp. NPDC049758 TaxID=3154360 RepID=UPI00341A8A27
MLVGVIFTAFGLVYTARTLAATQEGQVTDRYTKAVEQLASPATDVRLGALYALQRIAIDSSRDRPTIRNLLAAFVRNHDACSVQPLPKQCSMKDSEAGAGLRIELTQLPTDTRTALNIARALTVAGDDRLDLARVRFPSVDLRGIDLSGMNLTAATLRGADLSNSILIATNLRGANLTRASLNDANMSGADLGLDGVSAADMRNTQLGRTNLRGANLNGVDLSNANMILADLRNAELMAADLTKVVAWQANMSRVSLTNASLKDADLREVDLRGAYLGGMKEMSPEQVRKMAITDATTTF